MAPNIKDAIAMTLSILIGPLSSPPELDEPFEEFGSVGHPP